ncbi:MAG: thioredoxin [Deltaproteobacteria bacterium]|nr:thioredoxin [Deltaproteobacteria bacterium]
MAENMKDVSDDTFESVVLESDTPVLIDFWATWCAPCKAIAPTLEELAKDYDGKVKIVKMNVDDNPSTPGKYGVRGIPTLILFKGGEIVDQLVGAIPKAQIKDLVEKGL